MARCNQHSKKATPITDKEFETVCQLVEKGTGLLKACIQTHIANESFYQYIRTIGESANIRYAQAKEKQIEALIDTMDNIHDECMQAVETVDDPKRANAIVQAYRLRIDDYKWRASKLKPKKYGDRLDLTTGGNELPNKIAVEFVGNPGNSVQK